MAQSTSPLSLPSASGPALAVLAAACVLAGCFSVGTAPRAPEKQVEALQTSALTGRTLSVSSERTLRLALLDELAEDDPALAVRNLVALGGDFWGPSYALAPATSAAELSLSEARRLEETDPRGAAGYFLSAAELALEVALGALDGEISPFDPRARLAGEIYNYSTARLTLLARRFISESRDESGWPRLYSVRLEGPLGAYEVDLRGDAAVWNANVFDLRPADEIEVEGLRNRHRHAGLGAPMVIVRRRLPERALPTDGLYQSYWTTYALTSVLSFEETSPSGARTVRLEMHDPLGSEEVEVGDRTVPLEADYTAPLAVLGEIVEPQTHAQGAVLRAERYLDEAGIYLIEPYRPEKIPLLLVHGLQSSALTWLELTNDLRGDADLRRRYQVWAFNYPSGLPFSIASAILRQSLEQTLDRLDPERAHPATSQMVMIGHSMGGLLVRCQATDAEDILWRAVSSRPFDDVDFDSEDLELLRRAYLPVPMPELARVVFVATPHRGSRLAAGALGRLASSLVKLPESLEEQYFRLVDAGFFEAAGDDAPDSIISLSPESPIIVALQDLEIKVPFHTVVGDRNTNDDETTDGFVPLASSHLEGAESEVIVPSGHDPHQHPMGISEIRRILLEHLRWVDSAVGDQGRPVAGAYNEQKSGRAEEPADQLQR